MQGNRHPARERQRFIECEQDLVAAGEAQISHGGDQQNHDQPQVEPGDAEDVAEEQLMDAALVAAHKAERHHGDRQ